MKIEIDAESFYERLNPDRNSEEQHCLDQLNQLRDPNNWKKKSRKNPGRENHFRFHGQGFFVPAPFTEGDLIFRRQDQFYSGEIDLIFGYSDPRFHGIMELTNKKLEEFYGKLFVPAGFPGGGYILSGNEPFIKIERDANAYSTGIGLKGLAKRRLNTFEEFSSDMISLEKVTNNALNFALLGAVEIGVIKTNPDITVQCRS